MTASHSVPDRSSVSSEPCTDEPQGEVRAVPARHYGQWAGATVCVAFLIWLGTALANVESFKYRVVAEYQFQDVLLHGLVVTVELAVLAQVIGTVLGVIIALARFSENPIFRIVSWGYIWFFRSTPLLVQLIFWFNLSLLVDTIRVGLPGGLTLWSAPTNHVITGFSAALLGLSLHQAAYMAEIIRAGIASVDPGQSEAALALGMRNVTVLRRIIVPQAIPVTLPPTGNQFISILKDTSLVSVIAGGDLLTQAQNLYSGNFLVLELLVVATIWYLVLTTVASTGQYYLERRFSRRTAAPRRRPKVARSLGFQPQQANPALEGLS